MIWTLITTFIGDNWQWVAGALGGLLALFGARQSGKKAEQLKQAKKYESTRKRMDDAKGSSGNTSDDVDWLSDYGSK